MEVLLLSGLSGAGKSTAAKYLEDMGYFCMDNVPAFLLEAMVEAFSTKFEPGAIGHKVCLVTDVRSMENAEQTAMQVRKFLEKNPNSRLLYLEAKQDILLSRYKQSRRNHPLGDYGNLLQAFANERKLLTPMREIATDVIDTSSLSNKELRSILQKMFTEARQELMQIYLQSFGYKYGLPMDADIVVDMRFLPNPFYIEELRDKTGLDQEVQDYIFTFEVSSRYLQIFADHLEFVLPYYQREGKMRLNIAVGCTGGQHRSVTFVEKLKQILDDSVYNVFAEHRDLRRIRTRDS